ncbi:MAG: Na+/H+ antiporter NhaA [Bacteroidetes bacterium]|nr:Na+/H+ antiporter NhaA [Bacteroidota bacterium]
MNFPSELTPFSRRPVDHLLKPFQQFAAIEASGGILLILAAIAALIWANSPFSDSYNRLLHIPVTLGAGTFVISKPLFLWINDGLMAVFFFVAGLEIKRELLYGELNSIKKAALPAAAAIGGMILPAGLYFLINRDTPFTAGWGIPMATDIAFALGVLTLMGNRVPLSLKIFLTALAIIDDLGAVLVIALFYTGDIGWTSLAAAGGILLVLVVFNRIGIRAPGLYLFAGFFLWAAFLKSGIHATLAGVLLALTIPSTTRIDREGIYTTFTRLISFFKPSVQPVRGEEMKETQASALSALKTVIQESESPAQRLEHQLHPWVTWLIMPVFALANAGITFSSGLSGIVFHPVSIGVLTGLFAGKQAGILLFSWIFVRMNLAGLPDGVSWRQIWGVSAVAGIGFTMSLFIAGLAFPEGDVLNAAKAGIVAGSLLAGAAGWLILRKR